MNILADKYLYKVNELIPPNLNLDLFNPDQGLPKSVSQYDGLLVRTVIPINKKTLPDTGNIRFIGTASAGFDHLDLNYLKGRGIYSANSAGCNANAVAEYVITALYKWAEEKKADLQRKKIGIIGCGHTGSALSAYLQKLKLNTVLYDPPEAERNANFRSATLDELLQCDILSFHTPLTTTGSHPTLHMCDFTWLKNGFDLIINAARGGVVCEKDLKGAWAEKLVKDYVLDVWEQEPFFSDEMARNAFIATPHIAGYSEEAKTRATGMIVTQLADFFELDNRPRANFTEEKKSANPNGNTSLADFLWKHHKIKDYDRELRELINLESEKKGSCFAKVRSETELRIEFRTMVQWFNRKSIPEAFSVLFG
ncbi:MAG: 4-phosphoerythronate dehydrogenase [Balneolaceae bacterium]